MAWHGMPKTEPTLAKISKCNLVIVKRGKWLLYLNSMLVQRNKHNCLFVVVVAVAVAVLILFFVSRHVVNCHQTTATQHTCTQNTHRLCFQLLFLKKARKSTAEISPFQLYFITLPPHIHSHVDKSFKEKKNRSATFAHISQIHTQNSINSRLNRNRSILLYYSTLSTPQQEGDLYTLPSFFFKKRQKMEERPFLPFSFH